MKTDEEELLRAVLAASPPIVLDVGATEHELAIEFLANAVHSGMADVDCWQCGMPFLTRSDSPLCPPCRGFKRR